MKNDTLNQYSELGDVNEILKLAKLIGIAKELQTHFIKTFSILKLTSSICYSVV